MDNNEIEILANYRLEQSKENLEEAEAEKEKLAEALKPIMA